MFGDLRGVDARGGGEGDLCGGIDGVVDDVVDSRGEEMDKF